MNISEFFSLSYASYLVIPRLALEHMPEQWQEQMVDLIEEIPEEAREATYHCTKRVRGRYVADPWCDYRRDWHGVAQALDWPEKSKGEIGMNYMSARISELYLLLRRSGLGDEQITTKCKELREEVDIPDSVFKDLSTDYLGQG